MINTAQSQDRSKLSKEIKSQQNSFQLKKQTSKKKPESRIQIENEIKYLNEYQKRNSLKSEKENSVNTSNFKKEKKSNKTNIIAKTPTNTSVTNATLINQSPYYELAVTINEAPISAGGFNGCNVSGFNIIYYKFTAEADGFSDAYIYNNNGSDIQANSSFVIYYTAADLNATSESDLTSFSACSFGNYTGVNVTKGTTYYIAIHRNGNFQTNIGLRIPLDVSDSEKTALTDLYNSTNGSNWNRNTNWNTTAPVSLWDGVTVKQGHVYDINLWSNNLDGSLSESIEDLTEIVSLQLPSNIIDGSLPNNLQNLSKLERLDVSNNELNGVIPNLSNQNLQTLWLQGNLYEFGDLEQNFNEHRANINSFRYSANATPNIDLDASATVTVGENRELSVTTSGENNAYSWYKDNTLLGESTDGKWNLENIQIKDFGKYICNITNTLVVNTTMISENTLIGDNTDPTTTTDYNTLVDLYTSFGGNTWDDSSNWLSSEPLYKWKGIIIDENYRVVKLDLSNNKLSGSIPRYIQNLNALKVLDIGGNSLTGSIPNTLGNLSDLEILRLNSNQLENSIPSSLGSLTKLTILSLSSNQLTGNIPTELGNLTNLDELILGNNQISGSIPKELGNLSNLTWLHLWGGNLTGNIPKEIGNLTKLERLYIIDQKVEGEIPKELGNLANCIQFILWNNNLTGEIPKELSNLSKAVLIYLNGNKLTGAIPNEMNSLTSLITFNADNNNLTGNVPNFSNYKIESFNINFNNFIFSDLETNHSNNASINGYNYNPQNKLSEDEVKYLTIGDNITLNATIAGSNNQYQWYKNNVLINNATNPTLSFTNIQIAELGDYECRITHPTVSDLTLQTGVFSVRINNKEHPDYNALVAFYNSTKGDNWTNNTNWLDNSKTLNEWQGVILENGRVVQLNLQNNNVFPNITSKIGELTELKAFSVTNETIRYFGSNLPESFCNLTKLEYFNISNLGFSGHLPSLTNCNSGNLWYFDISNNYFTGSVPQQIANLPNLQYCLLSNNEFNGTIPDFSNISSLLRFDISNNNFQFGDFENQYALYSNNTNLNFGYSPQKQISAPDARGMAIDESYTFDSNVSGSDNIYWWFKRNDLGGGRVISNDKNFMLTINSESDYGDYWLEVASSIVPNLLLSSADFSVDKPASTHPDYNALVALYNSTNGNNWTNSWNLTAPINTWFGLTFDTNNRVEFLDIYNNNLTGTIPVEIGNLPTIKRLNVYNNNLESEIPKEIWNLINLTDLRLGLNNLSLSNGIPTEIKNLTNLELLNLSTIELSQPLQPELFKLVNLNRLIIENCGLTGNLPKEFADITDVFLYNNEFEGEIPSEIIENKNGNNFLYLNHNYFDFTDLKPLVEANNYENLSYSPQKTKDTAIETTIASGEDITITVDDQGLKKTGKQKNATGNIYIWYKNNEVINGETTNSLTLKNVTENDNGVYYCEITNPTLPDLTIRRANVTITIDATASVETSNLLENVKVYPNPTSTIFTIQLGELKDSRINIYDINGKEIIKKKLSNTIEKIDISRFENGVYMLSITSGNKKVIKRIIKI